MHYRFAHVAVTNTSLNVASHPFNACDAVLFVAAATNVVFTVLLADGTTTTTANIPAVPAGTEMRIRATNITFTGVGSIVVFHQ